MSSYAAHANELSKKGEKVGFASVADWMGLDADNEPFIFKRFNSLSARNILYMQSDILKIEEDLDNLDCIDATSGNMNNIRRARKWEDLSHSHELGESEAVERMTLIVALRAKLKEYHETLLLQNEVSKLRKPGDRTVTAFSQWLINSNRPLGGRAETYLEDRGDLISLKSSREPDYLSVLMRRYWPAKAGDTRDALHGIGRFEEKHITLAVAVVDVIITAVLLIGSITSLYFVQEDSAKLGLVAIFTALFALSIGFITNARRAEIFAATAAYAAVLVVFISGDISNQSSGG